MHKKTKSKANILNSNHDLLLGSEYKNEFKTPCT